MIMLLYFAQTKIIRTILGKKALRELCPLVFTKVIVNKSVQEKVKRMVVVTENHVLVRD